MMKGWRIAISIAIFLQISACASLTHIDSDPPIHETFKSTILKRYAKTDRDYHYRAYLITWKGSEVIATDPLGQTEYKVADVVDVLAMWIQVKDKEGKDIRALAFTLTEY
jgi:hypothetical protein